MTDLPTGQWWERMSADDYMRHVEAKRQAIDAEWPWRLTDAEWQITARRIENGPPLWPRKKAE